MSTPTLPGSKPRKPVNLHGDDLWWQLEDELPEYAQRHLDVARAGDADEAESLCFAAPNEYRGLIALAAFWSGVPNPAYREIMRTVWNHDHGFLLGAVQNDRRLIRRMFRAAAFEHPFSRAITVYRGAAGVNAVTASKGLSWTTSRDVACWFAYRFQGDRPPIVLRATVDAADVVFWDDERNEQEVIFKRPFSFEVDPDPDTWFQAAGRLRRRRKRHQAARLRKFMRESSSLAGSSSVAAAA